MQVSAGALPGVFDATVFTRRILLKRSTFIRPMHPKTEIRATREAVMKILSSGWVGQAKIHGHRAQIHLPADPDEPVLVYNRQGQLHKKEFSDSIIAELRRVFVPKEGWTVIDAEWVKPKDKLWIFDLIKLEDQLLNRLTFPERYAMLPRAYLSPHLATLPILTSVDKCLEALAAAREDDSLEGLVFKSKLSRGFEDTSIVRCRSVKRPGSLL
jgi:ATP-dependent DNA ligase